MNITELDNQGKIELSTVFHKILLTKFKDACIETFEKEIKLTAAISGLTSFYLTSFQFIILRTKIGKDEIQHLVELLLEWLRKDFDEFLEMYDNCAEDSDPGVE